MPETSQRIGNWVGPSIFGAGTRTETGSYTGNGAGGGQAIGVSFRPRAVFVGNSANSKSYFVVDPLGTDVEAGQFQEGGTSGFCGSTVINITATGFTADSGANTNLQAFVWLALR